jgi:hypothetical protein
VLDMKTERIAKENELRERETLLSIPTSSWL